MEFIITRLIFAHLLGDFVLQPTDWVKDRNSRHFKSIKLLYHALVHGALSMMLLGSKYWVAGIIVFISHYIIDLWKSYRADTIWFFILDQIMHLVVILIIVLNLSDAADQITLSKYWLTHRSNFWIHAVCALFITQPASIIIGKLTESFRKQIESSESESKTLSNAGKYIGIMERLIIYVLIIFDQYGAIGLLTAAKSILRFRDTKDQHAYSEYVLIGTLLSVGAALIVGLIAKKMIIIY